MHHPFRLASPPKWILMEPHLIGDLLEDLDSLILHLALNRVEKLVEASSQPKHSSKGLLCLLAPEILFCQEAATRKRSERLVGFKHTNLAKP